MIRRRQGYGVIFKRIIPFLFFIPMSGSDTRTPPASQEDIGRAPRTLAYDVTGIPVHPTTPQEGLRRASRRAPQRNRQLVPFEPHIRKLEDDFIRQLSVKMTMKKKRGKEDIRFKIEVLLRDKVIMRSYFDMITEEDNENS